jgi:hypothetical protein
MRVRLALATAFALALLLPLAGPPAVRAGSESFVSGSTTYVLAPADRAVHVTADMSFRNTKADTAAVRYYFTGYALGLQREARDVRVTRAGKRLAFKLSEQSDYLELEVTFGQRIFHNQTTTFRIQYDLPDSGPRSDGAIRVGSAIASFYAWSYGADQASVRIVLPAGFTPTLDGDPLTATDVPGGTVLAASAIEDRDRWFAWVTAEKPDALTATELQVPVGGQPESITMQSFPEDHLWAEAVRQHLTLGVPVLGELIGLPWPVKGTLTVSETYTPLLGGYAGYYLQGQAGSLDEIRITEQPDPVVILHEASHAWFNGDLFDARWIDEGLANEYAALALVRLGETRPDPEAVSSTAAAAFGLNGWPEPSRIDDQQTEAAERFGYNASWTVIRRLVDEVGVERMRLVMNAAHDHRIAYAGRPALEASPLGTTSTDWRGFLDLLEQVAGSQQAENLFSTWVVTPAQRSQLTAHGEAQAAYAQLVARGQGWRPGYVVRYPLAAWQFPAAEAAMADAQALLDERDRLDGLAQTLGLVPPDALQRAYEAAAIDLTAARGVAAREQGALDGIRDGRAALDAEHDLFTLVGLFGSTPQTELDAAGAAFGAADFEAAQAHAATALATVNDAETQGQTRVAVGTGAVVLILIAGGGTVLVLRRRRRREPAPVPPPASLLARAWISSGSSAEAPTEAFGARTGGEPSPGEWPVDEGGGAATLAAGPEDVTRVWDVQGEEREPPST